MVKIVTPSHQSTDIKSKGATHVDGLDYEYLKITPELAAELLSRNLKNRPITESTVRSYARQMKDGRWKLNGETIKISSSGYLIDGQHRLSACIRSGASFNAIVVHGLDAEAFDTIDTGRRRTAGDIISIDGVPNANCVASGVRFVLAIQRGRIGHRQDVTPSDIREFIDSNPSIVRSAQMVAGVRHVVSEGMSCALHFLFSKKDESLADLYFQDLKSGAGLSANDPVYLLREKLIKARGAKASLPDNEKVALMIRAFNFRRKSLSAKIIKGLVKNDAGEMNIPEII